MFGLRWKREARKKVTKVQRDLGRMAKAETGGTSERREILEPPGVPLISTDSRDKRRAITMEKVGQMVKDVYYDQFKWSVVKNIAFFLVGVKIAVECNGLTLMPPVSV